MLNEKIVLVHRVRYGQHYFTPLNETARQLLMFCDTRGLRKAFTENQLKIGRALGFEIHIQEEPPKHEF